MVNFYSLLELTETATEEEIRKAYRRLAKRYHPDVNKSPDAQAVFVLINKAYEVLMDRSKRFVYDQKRQQTEDPYVQYARWANEQKARLEAETLRKHRAYLKKKEELRKSKMYYPYMVTLYMVSMLLMGLSVLILGACAFAIMRYHVFMFFFLLPFICGAAYVFKITLDSYRKHRAYLS